MSEIVQRWISRLFKRRPNRPFHPLDRSPGLGDWSVPEGISWIEILAVGAGGGAGARVGGGEGKVSPIHRFEVGLGDMVIFTIGRGGGPGEDGGDTSVDVVRAEGTEAATTPS